MDVFVSALLFSRQCGASSGEKHGLSEHSGALGLVMAKGKLLPLSESVSLSLQIGLLKLTLLGSEDKRRSAQFLAD